MPRTCQSCGHFQKVYHSDWDGDRLRCMRDRTMRDGRVIRADGVGASLDFETDSVPEPQRAAGDKCGPERRHWVQREI